MPFSAPPDLLQQTCCNKQSYYLHSQQNYGYRADRSTVLLYPAGHAAQTAAQEDHALGRELVQPLGADSTLRVPHRPVLQGIHTAGGGHAAGLDPRSRTVKVPVPETDMMVGSNLKCVIIEDKSTRFKFLKSNKTRF